MDPVKYLTELRDYGRQIIQDINNRNVDLPEGGKRAEELQKRTISIALRALGSLAKAWFTFNTLRQFAMLLVVPAQASVFALFCWATSAILAHDLAVVGMNMRPGIRQQVNSLLSAAKDRLSDAVRAVSGDNVSTENIDKAANAIIANTPVDLSGTLILRHLFPHAERAAHAAVAAADAVHEARAARQ